eukprot:CAMPEP_0179083288 /NCGR_PEP_ID=MMETSP0796-20121207/37602_1 /TAXON_ID=73915 /ORGANISM="Pyrodinium bahamense, Strain pbaha01" /LENGTH=338 /DNA_ID=CAMNT_0020780693 /DNA_START=27 /DNA_END=1043 /DNA_ORIENTATION=+
MGCGASAKVKEKATPPATIAVASRCCTDGTHVRPSQGYGTFAAPWLESTAVQALETAFGEAVIGASALRPDQRMEHIGLYLIAKAEDGRLPDMPEGAPQDLPADELTRLQTQVEAALQRTEGMPGRDARLLVGQHLCPRAAPIPAEAYLTSYTLCREPPYIVQVDAFLQFPGPGYHFSMSRVAEAKRQGWQLIRHMQQQGKCDRLICLCGNPAVGKSTWIYAVGAREACATTAVFFDDLLNNRRRRGQWWEGFRGAGLNLPVEVVAVTRSFERAVASNRARGAKGGHEVPLAVMERYQREYEPPGREEGFVRIRAFENEYNEENGKGGFVLTEEVEVI